MASAPPTLHDSRAVLAIAQSPKNPPRSLHSTSPSTALVVPSPQGDASMRLRAVEAHVQQLPAAQLLSQPRPSLLGPSSRVIPRPACAGCYADVAVVPCRQACIG